MKNRVLINYLRSMDPEADVQFEVPGKSTRYNVNHAEEPSTIDTGGAKKRIILKG